MLRPTPTDQYKKIRISPQGTKIRTLQQLRTFGQFPNSNHAKLEAPHTKTRYIATGVNVTWHNQQHYQIPTPIWYQN